MFQALRVSDTDWSAMPQIPVSDSEDMFLGGHAGGLEGRLFAQVSVSSGGAATGNKIMEFDDIAGSWSELTQVPEISTGPSGASLTGAPLTSVQSFELASSAQALYLAGGTPQVARFDLDSKEWTLLPEAPANVERIGSSKGVLLARTSSGQVLRLAKDLKSWESLPATGLGGTIHHLAAGPDGEAYIALENASGNWTIQRHRPQDSGWSTYSVPSDYDKVLGISVDSDGEVSIAGVGSAGPAPSAILADRLDTGSFIRLNHPADMAGFTPSGAPPRLEGGGATTTGNDIFRTRSSY